MPNEVLESSMNVALALPDRRVVWFPLRTFTYLSNKLDLLLTWALSDPKQHTRRSSVKFKKIIKHLGVICGNNGQNFKSLDI